jgi:hypothetical protein
VSSVTDNASVLIREGLGIYASGFDEAFEVRVLDVRDGNRVSTFSGYYSDSEKAAEAIEQFDGRGACYITLNPVKAGVEARCHNRLMRSPKHATGDSDIARRRNLLLDFDPRRPSGISATDAEHDAAIYRAKAAAKWLRDECGWPNPALIDSGNGAHLVFRIDLPNNDASKVLLKAALAGVGLHFTDAAIDVDNSVFNAARIVKVPGTLAIKGDDIPGRPHRRSRVLYAPESMRLN